MVVLVGVFNDAAPGAWVTFERIQEITQIPPADLRRTLQSLSVAKYKILIKSSKGKDVADADGFSINAGFTSPLNKIKILSIVGGGGGGAETEQERSDTMGKVDEDRRHEVEASIVRIMKSRKRLDHNSLVNDVVSQLSARFNPNPALIKRRIEALIEREYLKRDDKDRRYYDYVA
ncbi:Cullin-3 [Dinochytrium kinnereticum]|nr:Cullin-3 [Dinochytrium kinnereticum]